MLLFKGDVGCFDVAVEACRCLLMLPLKGGGGCGGVPVAASAAGAVSVWLC